MTNNLRAWKVAASPITDTKPLRTATTLELKQSQSFPATGPKKKVRDMQRDPIHAKENQRSSSFRGRNFTVLMLFLLIGSYSVRSLPQSVLLNTKIYKEIYYLC